MSKRIIYIEEIESLIKDLNNISETAKNISNHLEYLKTQEKRISERIEEAETALKNKTISTPDEYFKILNGN